MIKKRNCPIELLSNYDKNWGLPKYENPGDAGFDLRAAFKEEYVDLISIPNFIKNFLSGKEINNTQLVIPCGFKVEIPNGFQLEIRPRSGLAAKQGITVVNSPGTIDSGYRGEIMVILANLGTRDLRINRGDRIAQAVLMPVYHAHLHVVDSVSKTVRGEGGLGSTQGVKNIEGNQYEGI